MVDQRIPVDIFTSGKGGVGKTLLTLLSAANHAEKVAQFGSDRSKRQLCIVLDINNVNADAKRMLRPSEREADDRVEIIKIFGNEADIYMSIAEANTPGSDGVLTAWLSNPFFLINPLILSLLLRRIAESSEDIGRKFNGELTKVVIDTNYHFCNLFSGSNRYNSLEVPKIIRDPSIIGSNGQIIGEPIFDDYLLNFFDIHIWFLWVLRQVRNFADASRDGPKSEVTEADFIPSAASGLEQVFSSQAQVDANDISLFRHVFSPVIALQTNERGFLKQLERTAILNTREAVISEEMRALRMLKHNKKSSNFDFIRSTLVSAWSQTGKSNAGDEVRGFYSNLKQVLLSGDRGVPKNCLFFDTLDANLIGYTESDGLSMAALRQSPAYSQFSAYLTELK